MPSSRTSFRRDLNPLSRLLAELRAAGRPLLDLSVSDPSAAGLAWEPKTLSEALAVEGVERHEPDPLGRPEARAALSAWLAGRGQRAPPERLCLTASTSEAYGFLFKLLCDPGEAILVPRPSYPLFELLARLDGVEASRYRLRPTETRWRLSVDELAAGLPERTRAVVVVQPNNPTGSLLSAEEANALAGLCARRGLALVSDEVFAEFPWVEDSPTTSLAEAAQEAGVLSFRLSGLSKSAGLPQLKLGWIAVDGPEDRVRDAMARLEFIADTYLSVGGPVQRALPALLEGGAPFRQRALERIRGNLQVLDASLGAGPLRRLPGGAGWSAVLELPSGVDEERLVLRLLEGDGLLVHPGHFFELGPGGHLVLSLLTPPEDLARGLERLAAASLS